MSKIPYWFVCWSNGHDDRTTDTSVFFKLKDAREFAAECRYGYIMRQSYEGVNTLVEYFGGFNPSAGEGLRMRALGMDI